MRTSGPPLIRFPKKLQTVVPVLFFALLLLAGVVLHDDYGGFTDELLHIQTAAINYKYILLKFIPPENIPPIPIYDLEEIPDMRGYVNQYYGEAAMMPTLFVNLIPGLSLSDADFLNFRRFYTFGNFFIALICFYLLLRIRFSDQWIPAIGTFFLLLTPRFFAESFYNSKDIIFFCWFLISIFGIGLFLLQNRSSGLLIFAFAFGLAVNTRIYGIVLLPAFLCVSLVDNAIHHGNAKKRRTMILLSGALALFFFYIVTPYLWENPVAGFLNALRFSATAVGISPTDLISETNRVTLGNHELFMGKFIIPGETWYYIPVWMGITIPVFYILTYCAELFFLCKQTIQTQRTRSAPVQYLFDGFCFGLFFLCLAGIILEKPTLYHGWRHVYFLFAPFIYLSVCGFGNLWNISFQKKPGKIRWKTLLAGISLVSFATTGFWMVKNHPLDFAYFNEIGRHYASQFTRDYWGVASKKCILDLAGEYTEGQPLRLGVNADLTYGSTQISLLRFPDEVQKRFTVIWKNENADYLCFSYNNILGNDHVIPEFEIMKTYQVDGYDVAAIYRRINE